MKTKVLLSDEARSDIMKLPQSLQKQCIDKLSQLEQNHKLGRKLTIRNGKDLRGLRKIYFDEARYRIVYRLLGDTYEIIGVDERIAAEVVAVGPRDNEEVYETTAVRLERKAYKEEGCK